mgnify:CR=1 FL=1
MQAPPPSTSSPTSPSPAPGAAPAASGARAHVLTPDFDFLRDEVLRDPYPLYRQLQDEQPVFWSEQMDAWVITRHADVDAALKNPELFSSVRINKILYGYADRRVRDLPLAPLLRPVVRQLARFKMRRFVEMASRFMWQNDPPEHTRLRKLMHQGFTAALVTRMRPLISERVHKLIDQLVAQSFDVHRTSAGEVQQGLLALRRAEQPAGAARHRLVLAAHHVRAAHRTGGEPVEQHETRQFAAAALQDRRHHLGDHVACTAHDHPVADAHVLAVELVLVVQRRA